MITYNKHNTREMFEFVDGLIPSDEQTAKHISADELASNFNASFEDKITNIRLE